ncbi:OLC1v1030517C1 [Oldenlandia corymbosa var. corymbosa]|uniref:OLC1v1030517C1 n=1 Tax=Oldenlandia corymbosa var. corymbosa TaxID=529605 RepID=A0AAV1CH37_OLDCO|nr:OLC1v1030517C1 [Oldenlandia corymbosa var. corymbosa]
MKHDSRTDRFEERENDVILDGPLSNYDDHYIDCGDIGGVWYYIEVVIKNDRRLKPKYGSHQARIKSTKKSTRSRQHNGQANEIDEKVDKVRVDVLAEKRKSTKRSTRCRRVHGRAKEVDEKVVSRASSHLSVDKQVDEVGQNFLIFLF